HRTMAGLLDDADAFAKLVLRADPPADLGHGVGGGGGEVGFAQPSFRLELKPIGNVVLQGTAGLAERHAALAAAAGLLGGGLGRELAVDLLEVQATLFRRPLGR